MISNFITIPYSLFPIPYSLFPTSTGQFSTGVTAHRNKDALLTTEKPN
ncbi:MAG: hypothetical protein F6J90_32770 [Moorea sp. SIOASIH]|nr:MULTISPECIES: hypothetical protein [Moorena]NEO40853.1 hypothetical protein [Moorena sp. SIOASIH]NEO89232.1 hypothetical protein [Moorena sp. SIO3G5]